MNPDYLTALLKRVRALEDRQVRYRQGVVTDDTPLSVALGGSSTACTDVKALDSALPLVVDDPVAVLTFGNDLLVLGKIA